ncbi:MAG TPA: DNA-processing protein DprA [Acholeplasmataceae bacterium]|nr:DNA-processing protein DprA [Acholeplasmataceae bacterium]
MTNRDMVILLSSQISKSNLYKPYTNTELNKIIHKLKSKNIELKDIYDYSTDELITTFFDKESLSEKETLFIERLSFLMQREGSLAFNLMEIKKWGINIVTIYDENYPLNIKKHLGVKAPFLLYYCGNLNILNNNLIGFVGSRAKKTSEDDKNITKAWAQLVIDNNYGVVSGGASGIDTYAIQTALENNSPFVEFLASEMVNRIKIVQISKAIQNQKALLISEVSPFASFNAGMAMARNKYIYMLASKVIVIKAEYSIKNKKKTGGTWNGAIENINSNYKNLFVVDNKKNKGNQELIELGGLAINQPDINSLFTKTHGVLNEKEKQIDEKMIQILKDSKTLNKIKWSKREIDNIEIIKAAINLVSYSFKDLNIDKTTYEKLYKFCYNEATKEKITQISLFDLNDMED